MNNAIILLKKEEQDFIENSDSVFKEEMERILTIKKPIYEVNLGLCVIFFLSGLVSTIFYWFYYGLEMFKEGTIGNMMPIYLSVFFAFLLFAIFVFPILTLKQPDLDQALMLKENKKEYLKNMFYNHVVSAETKEMFKNKYNITLSDDMTNNHVVNYILNYVSMNTNENNAKLILDIVKGDD